MNRVSGLIVNAKMALLTDASARLGLAEATDDPLYWGLRPSRGGADEVGNEGRHPELLRWYHPDTLQQLRGIWTRIANVGNPSAKNVLAMLFSDTLFACASTKRPLTSGTSRRRHHWGWVADNVRPNKLVWHDALRIFGQSLRRAEEVLRATPLVGEPVGIFQRANAHKLPLSSGYADAVVTSPPYLGMIDYATANRLTYMWFGWSIEEDRELEIGARYRRNRASEPERYLHEMEQAAVEIRRVLKPGGFCAIVIGASRKFPGMSEEVIRIFSTRMDLFWGPQARTPSRRRVAERGGSVPTEYICVFRNGK